MTYPGTKPRVPSAIESSLISRVTELEKERDELVEALREIVEKDAYSAVSAREHNAACSRASAYEAKLRFRRASELLAKYPLRVAPGTSFP